jgi:hypothetical protein
MTAVNSVVTVAKGKDLEGTGVWSFVKVKGSPTNRAILGSILLALTAVIANPQLVSAFTTDASIN